MHAATAAPARSLARCTHSSSDARWTSRGPPLGGSSAAVQPRTEASKVPQTSCRESSFARSPATSLWWKERHSNRECHHQAPVHTPAQRIQTHLVRSVEHLTGELIQRCSHHGLECGVGRADVIPHICQHSAVPAIGASGTHGN
jgi:hypothetical protein